MSRSFNLVDSAWIPCVTEEGVVQHLGILNSLTDAHRVTEIRDQSPLVTVALHRLLLAVLHRVFGPDGPADWARLWSGGRGTFDPAKLTDYLRGPFHPRFDLFDATYPFYQTASLPVGPPDPRTGRPKYQKPVWRMAHEVAYSDNMALFSHFTDDDWDGYPPAQAARWLVALQSFALGGLITCLESEKRRVDGSADAGQLIKSAVTLARGSNLFQTLALNLVHYSADDDAPFAFRADKDLPAWERADETRPADRPYAGYLDLLTWQSRRVRLVPAEDGGADPCRVAGVVMMKGFQLPGGYERLGKETMVGFVEHETAGWQPLGFRQGRELWRDSHVLFQRTAEGTRRPPVLDWVNDLVKAGHKDETPIDIEVFGISADRARLFFWRHESFPLPLAYLDDGALVGHLKAALTLAEKVAKEALRPAAWAAAANRLTADAGMSPDKKRVSDVLDAMAPERLYWSRLELPFRGLLADLAAALPDARDARVAAWFWDTLHAAAVRAFERSVEVIDAGRDLKAVIAGRGVLFANLKKIRTESHIPDRVKAGAP